MKKENEKDLESENGVGEELVSCYYKIEATDSLINFGIKFPESVSLKDDELCELQEAFLDLISDFFGEKFSDENVKENNSESSSTQPMYIDSTGRVFTPSDIYTKNYRPKGKIKGYSMADIVMGWKPAKRKKRKGKKKR